MHDFYCDDVLSGKTPVVRVMETERVLAFRHTRPAYAVHIVVIRKLHIPSLVDYAPGDDALMPELLGIIGRGAGRGGASVGGTWRGAGDHQSGGVSGVETSALACNVRGAARKVVNSADGW